jgi:hypothetical protein
MGHADRCNAKGLFHLHTGSELDCYVRERLERRHPFVIATSERGFRHLQASIHLAREQHCEWKLNFTPKLDRAPNLLDGPLDLARGNHNAMGLPRR